MHIDSDFEGGSILILDASDPSAVALALRPDNAADFRQWFCFRVRDAEGVPCVFRIVNAGESSYPAAWTDYRAVASYDGERWFRVPTEFDGEALTIQHTPDDDVAVYACFAPYAPERHEALLERARSSPRASVVTLGKSVEGRPMSAVVCGDPSREVRRIWIVAQQHPGETMAAWFMEGVLCRLLDEEDPISGALLDKAVVYLVPNMNPDGRARGNYRTNAAGRDLNREWSTPSMEESPEVLVVREAIEDSGVDMFVDVHGDESIPYVFAFGSEGAPSYSTRIASLEERFASELERIDDDFQREEGYERDPPGQADFRFANEYVAERFGCLSVGLEMPFKDNANRPDDEAGWSPERCRRFGRSVVEAALACVDALR